jgi:hypothetical protein
MYPSRSFSAFSLFCNLLFLEMYTSACSQSFLVDCLSSIDFFQKTPRSVGIEIARVATFLKVDKGGMVFEQGTVGTAFYVILSGSVSIRVKDARKPDSLGYEAAVLISGKSFGELGTCCLM